MLSDLLLVLHSNHVLILHDFGDLVFVWDGKMK